MLQAPARQTVLALLLLVAGFAAGALHAPGAVADAQMISIQSFSFQPGEITITAGDTITWSNDQPAIPHTVTADDNSFDSGPLMTGDTVAWEFDSPGVYAYHCSIHRGMMGTITVVSQ